MFRNSLCSLLVAAAMFAGVARGGESPSALMEKAIYTEETVGDLDAAIKLYEKVVAEAKAAEAVGARAQFRLGQCLLKQGKKDQATAAFEELVRQFPKQKDLVARAQQYLPEKAGLKLGPVPWADGEMLQYSMRLAAGLPLGTMIYAVQSATLDGRRIWRTTKITYVVASDQQGLSRVDADFDSFHPLSSVFRFPAVGDTAAEYKPREVVITTRRSGQETTRKLELDKIVYDNEQGVEVFRRLPLDQVTEMSVPILAPFGAGEIDIGLKVMGQETVEVPAGKFACRKVNLSPVNQTFWFSTDEHRYLVKIEANNALMELTAICKIVPNVPKKYEDPERRFALSLPSDWFTYLSPSTTDEKSETTLYLVDPTAEAKVMVKATAVEKLSEEQKKSPRAWLEKVLGEAKQQQKDFQVRGDGWQTLEVSGRPAARAIADYVTGGDRKMAECDFALFGQATALRFSVQLPRDRLDALVPREPRAESPLLSIVRSIAVK